MVWSNVAKCENPANVRGVPLTTQRDCAHRFLVKELAALPPTWTAIAAGRDAYVALAYLSLNRVVLGVPHPTGANPQFSRLWSDSSTLQSGIRSRVDKAMSSGGPSCLWLAVL